MECLNCKHFPENGDTYYDCEFHYECIKLGGVYEPKQKIEREEPREPCKSCPKADWTDMYGVMVYCCDMGYCICDLELPWEI